MYYKKFRKYLNEFLTGDEVPFEAFAKMVVKYKDDRNRVLSDVLPVIYRFIPVDRTPKFGCGRSRPDGPAHDSSWSVHNIHWRPQFYICDVCRLNYDLIFHSEDEMDLKNSIIEKLNLGLQLMSRDEYYEVNRQIIFWNLRVFQTPAILFLNQKWKNTDPT